LSETATATKHTSHAIQVPLVVDADNGYGDEDNVIRTIYELESAGAAAIQLEDQVLPKRCGHAAGKKVLPLPAYIKKLESALRARQTPLVIIARTDALSLDEGIRRAKIFQSVGADAVIIDGLKSLDDVKRVGELPGHKQINLIGGGLTPILPAPELHKLGFK